MSRRRDLSSSDWFHVVQKGADAQDIFSAPSHRSVYEDLMADAFARERIELHAYAWMTNHTHMLCHTPAGGLPDAMHRLGTRYAGLFNGWTDRSGPLFTARYFSEPITTDEQLVQVGRYIHRNPIPIVGIARLADYPWSSLGALTGRRSRPEWLATGAVAGSLGPPDYERFVLTSLPSDRHPFGDLPPSVLTRCVEIEGAVAAVVGRSVVDLRTPRGKVSDEPRMLMIALAVEFRSAPGSDLAARYGLSDQRSVRRIARHCRTLTTRSPAFATLRRRVLAALDQPALAA